MEWIDVAGCLAFRAYSLPRIAKFGVGVVWRVGLFTQWIREGCLSQRSYSRAGRNVVGCGRARFLREHVTAVRLDVLIELHASTHAALVCFGHDRSQLAVFGV